MNEASILMPTLSDHEYLLLPESVGWYREFPENEVSRKQGALNNFSIHLVVDGKGFIEAEHSGFLHLTLISTLTYAVVAEFVTQAAPWAEVSSPKDDNRILELLPFIRQEACRPFDLDYWSRRAGVSSYYFCRLFKKSTQMTPMTFITLCRLQNSKQWLLEKQSLTVKEIAEHAGYPSVSYFNKRFHEQEGMTPTVYRRLYRRE
ncbi:MULTISPECIES: helix-turn-helix domain-containing protein [unclassified Paenibacillus]|uniref:helix-turn-helix domain-containing protein n=1 Tax=unclassified Paenibacillus TaxID=185978 RepID=UPI001AE7B532|nr:MULTISPECIES: helix-turn-helix domain-containing protein [unclassified Paenibacillus]MBP1155524.1 AraC-like DNA-binding protein [Paenibacillus sp. PvP091]MBP1169090.1 AraC-like DNA-binding protein [Paenibacillus sp. PvR098]MBP2440118.1 AraC-like DNA-binding protein [Paenibacillus sp. PvP052]